MAPDDQQIRQILEATHTIAIVGASANPWRASHGVMAYLLDQGFRVIPVNPGYTEVLGERCYPALAEVPESVDLVDVFRRSQFTPDVAREAVAVGARTLWLQIGVVSQEAAEIARRGGLRVVMDRCTKIEHARLVGRRRAA